MTAEFKKVSDLEILERSAFAEAEIDILEDSLKILAAHRFAILDGGSGLARLVNLLQWDAGSSVEYLDDDAIYADQAIHFAIHHLMDALPQSKSPYAMLYAECVASCADLYMLGKLSNAGLETDFTHETLESLGSYYEQYASGENQLESVFQFVLASPFDAMKEAAGFLYSFVGSLLRNPVDPGKAGQMCVDRFYPLAHHFNVSNWILTIRSHFPEIDENIPEPIGLLLDETEFVNRFKW